jgi:glutathione synthase/RimK-type ligase-like ATP-grasp enzyme
VCRKETLVTTVALATCEQFPQLDDEDRLIIPALAGLGIEAVPAVWTDVAVDWSTFAAVVVRETWDYAERRAEFLAWTAHVSSVSTLLNPADVIAWSTDKHYLQDIAEAGLSVVPTNFLEPGDEAAAWQPPADCTDFVVKPAISAGSRDTVRYVVDAPLDDARAHIARLLADGRSVMVQPYLDAVDTAGETAVLFLGGEYSHAIRKGPLLERGVEGERVEGLFVQEQIDPRDATPNELVTARAIVECIPGGFGRTLYARVDLIPDEFGAPRLLELELCEPSLFLSHSPGAADRLATAIAARIHGN